MYLKNLLKVSCFLLICFFAVPALAQNKTITGKVTDSKDGSALIGASVVSKGSTVGSITDVNGAFKLSVPESATTIVVSYIGYISKEVAITSGNVTISLDPNSSNLNEVLVVGYGTVRKKDATGAVVKVTSADFVQGVTTDPLQQLQGKAAGVVIATTTGDPNSTATVRVRGTTSLTGGNDPLYVIDGIAGADIRSVSPNDIESFDILKDASSAAIYGSRAASGVILITTKQGKAGKSQVTYNTYVASETAEHLIKFMDRSEYLSAYQSFYGKSMPVFNPASPSTTVDQGANTNWYKELLHTGFTENQNIALSGGTDKGHYRASASYIDQQGIARTSERKEFNGRFNFDQKTLNDKLLVTMNVSASHANANYTDGSAFLDAAAVPSVISVYDPLHPGNYQFINNTQEFNPVPQLLDITNTGVIDRITGNLHLDYTIVKGLNFSPYANGTRGTETGLVYYPPSNLVAPIADRLNFTPTLSGHGDVDKTSTQGTTETYGANFNYKGTFGKSRISALGGYEYNNFNYQGFRVGAHDYNDINLPNENINGFNSISTKDISSYDNGYILKSWLGRLDYNFDDKYYITANIRYDWSNKLGLNNQSGVFPSINAGWNISSEEFMKGVTWLSSLKLRGGYGQAGDQESISAYASQFLFGPNGKTYYDGASGTFLTSNFVTQNQNASLRWEVKTTTDVGIDFGLFNNRLTGSFDVYKTTTNHLLFTYTVPTGGTFFVPQILANIGALTNKGFDLTLNGKILTGSGLKWNIGGNLSLVRNKITNLSGSLNGTSFNVTQSNVGSTSGLGISGAISAIGYLKVGYPIGTLLLPQYAGLDANGNQTFWHYNTDGTRVAVSDPSKLNYADDGSTQDRKFYKTEADFTYGISNNFAYGNFDLSLFLRGQAGGKGFNENYMDYTSLQKLGTYAVISGSQSLGIKSSSEPSTYWLQSTAFLKIQNATFGYTFNIPNSNYIDKLHVYIAGNNLYTFTKYKGFDPELTTAGGMTGIDARSFDYPRPRELSFGINLTLK